MGENVTNRWAVIIAVENYQKSEINTVQYASADANAFYDVLINTLEVPRKNVLLMVDSKATKTSIENDVPYFIKQLHPDDRFYFYYAGHGFYSDGANYLTVYDTAPINLHGTTLSLSDLLLVPLEKANCGQSLLFLDACATRLKENLTGREIISDLREEPLKQFTDKEKYRAIFTSCSPGEKSFPSTKLQHGIWTWHLTEALKGNMSGAFETERLISDRSLRDYLKRSVEHYLTKEMTVPGQQTPHAFVSASETFTIVEFPPDKFETPEAIEKLVPDFNESFLRNRESFFFKNANGFNKKFHKVPMSHTPAADAFAQKLAQEEVKAEIETIYQNTKIKLKLKHADLKRGDSSLDCRFFRFYVDVDQAPDDFSQMRITRRLIIRTHADSLPPEIETVFPNGFDELIVPFDYSGGFSEVVSNFEKLEEKLGGKLKESETSGMVEYAHPSGLEINIDTNEKTIALTRPGLRGVKELISGISSTLKELSLQRTDVIEAGSKADLVIAAPMNGETDENQ